ncbi:MAG TPA: Rho termination factor N-terminal domain-containing protein, partial [Actinomycetes bacterium]|nr:Rho termination factor N-terminal domain-containing protein [Actinomycetes bacterium]
MSDSTDLLDAPPAGGADGESSGAKPARRKATGLSGMVLAELQGLASELGISGTARMRKGQLIEAIKERQSGGGDTAAPAAAK